MKNRQSFSRRVVKTLNPYGRHVIADLGGCDPRVLANVGEIKRAMVGSAKYMRASIVDSIFHAFNPFGVSGVVVIKESHVAIHTWPEHGFASIDIYTCGTKLNPRKAVRYLEEKLKAKKIKIVELIRRVPR